MDLHLKSKVALITGGSRGIGKAIALQLAQEGVDIVLAARTKDRLDAAAAEIAGKTGRKVIAIVVNTGDDASVKAMGEQAIAAMGHVDILVNAAAEPGGYAPVPALAEVKGELVDEEINVKVKGYIRCAQAVVASMKASKWGRIVNISGLAARQTGNIVGSLRNVAVSSLSKNLADELGPFGINVTCVHPGRHLHGAHPAGGAGAGEASELHPGGTAEAHGRQQLHQASRDRRRGGPRGDIPLLTALHRDQRRHDCSGRRRPAGHLLLAILATIRCRHCRRCPSPPPRRGGGMRPCSCARRFGIASSPLRRPRPDGGRGADVHPASACSVECEVRPSACISCLAQRRR